MLALKKKREAEAKAAKEGGSDAMEVDENKAKTGAEAPENNSSNKVSLLGIGGKKSKSKNGDSKGKSKKRTPGEIRIQKGKSCGEMNCELS